MVNLTTSEPQNIFNNLGNGLSVYLDKNNTLMLKDIRGKIAPLTDFIIAITNNIIIQTGQKQIFKVLPNVDNTRLEVGDYVVGIIEDYFLQGVYEGPDENLISSYDGASLLNIVEDTLTFSGSAIFNGVNGIDGNPTAPPSPLTVTGGNGSNSTLTTGVVVAGAAAEIKIEAGNGGNAVSSVDTNISAKGGDVYFVAGDGGIASGGSFNLDGSGGNASLQGGETRNGIAGFASLKAGNASGLEVEGGSVYIVPGFGNGLDDTDTSLYNGTIFLNLSPNLTSVRGNTVIGNVADDRINRLQVTGKVKVSSSVQVGNNSDTATADNVGAIRYREDGSNSYCEMVMQVSSTPTYAWVIIKQNIF